MKTVKIDDIAYKVPTKWDDVTLDHYLRLTDFKADKATKLTMKIVSSWTGIPEEIFTQAEDKLFHKIIGLMKFINTDIPIVPKKTIGIEGTDQYYNGDVKSLCFGQFLDVEFRNNEYKDDLQKALPFILAILYRPKDEQYNSDHASDNAEHFAKLPITDVFGICSFFLPILGSSRKASKICLMVSQALQTNPR